MVPGPGRTGRLQPTRLENRFGTGTGAVISAMVYPDATVASATYQRQMPPSRAPPVRHGWFHVSETGRNWGRAPLDASLASTPAPRARPNPRVRPVPRAGVVPRRLSYSDDSSDWNPNCSRQTEPQVEFPPSSPSSAYDTSYHTAPSSAYSEYHSFQ
ncbi:uncharacterized protein LOC113207189 [Frankliniella occidentalis]|uniref:Uncharacterized protein LOC113207189 n=1 Tax=Frankliniella occidentalis TaxID=133901 RepID=A0A9C6WNV2_FRAOC|nr:uncharacterized protein LOC113207189 [Frankliniella occidentalis]